MSVFSSLGRLFKKIWSFIKKLFKKLWPLLLIVAIVVISIYFPGFWAAAWGYVTSAFSTLGGWISTGWKALSGWASGGLKWLGGAVGSMGWSEWLKLAAGVALITNPEGVIDGISSVIGKIAKAIPSWVWLAGAGALVWWLLPSDRKESRTVVQLDTRGRRLANG